jgi:hypothetical protein
VLAISNSDDLALSVPTTSATTMHARMTRDTSATHLLTVEPEVKPLMAMAGETFDDTSSVEAGSFEALLLLDALSIFMSKASIFFI